MACPMNNGAGTVVRDGSQYLFSTGELVALVISPTDGFISRLLKQGPQAAPGAQSGSSKPARQDQLSISTQARQVAQPAGSHHLESRLMELYNQEGKNAA